MSREFAGSHRLRMNGAVPGMDAGLKLVAYFLVDYLKHYLISSVDTASLR
jgi:hypothetical protein